MPELIQKETTPSPETKPNQINFKLIFQVIAVLLFASFIYTQFINPATKVNISAKINQGGNTISSELEEKVLPSKGIVIPVRWGKIGVQMIEKGVIDQTQFEALYEGRGGFTEEDKKLWAAEVLTPITITQQNAGIMLNLLWGLGLGNKNPILENGPMNDPRYDGAENFASTGGWTIAQGDPMSHYSKYEFVILTPEQQQLVEEVSKNIYRPCCDNPTYFPDCNHGMAMLGLLELMASQGVSEQDMYKIALQVNSYWFTDTYLTLAKYFEKQGIDWNNVDPKQVLGKDYSSASGYQSILKKIDPIEGGSGGSCGV